MASPADPCSFSNFLDLKISKSALHLEVDFSKKILFGTVDHTFQVLNSEVKEAILDTSHLEISKVYETESGKELKFHLEERNEKFGSALKISLAGDVEKGKELKISIRFATTDKCTALGWMDPEQTSGKKHPFLYSQCQAIHARSLIPCQDSPSVKFRYTATMIVPSPLVALMSALRVGEPTSVDGGKSKFEFVQSIPIPSYLLALASGALESREIGPRSSVWAESEIVDKAASEFVDTEKFIKIGEDLTVPYVWGRYDILVLPGSFPYGGMENPCLTFVTPTIISGDRSLVNVVAHEIAHSWMGNLVTPTNWQHFWLNEGFTVFLERKIIGQLQGEQMRHFKSILGWEELEKSIGHYGEEHKFTALVPDLTGEDPDDAFSSVPYEKGFNFLFYLEKLVGGPQIFEPYVKAHVQKFQYQSITSDQFKEFFLEYFAEQKKKGDLDQIDWKAWFTSPGFPPVKPHFDQTLAEVCTQLAEKWERARASKGADLSNSEDYSNLSPEQKVVFLTQLATKEPLPEPLIKKMDGLYNITSETNCEIKFRWHILALKANYSPIFGEVAKFLGAQGRMKYIRPLYRALTQCSREFSIKTFNQNRSFYHPIGVKQLVADLQLPEK